MKIYVTGSKGLVGSRFLELIPKNWQVLSPEIDELNILEPASVKSFYERELPEVVVNFAAYTDVGKAEEERGDKSGNCWNINVTGVKNLVEAIDTSKTHFIQISTDMVFPGSKDNPGPYAEDATLPTNPDEVTWYGYTKGQGEKEALVGTREQATILRLIYPVRARFDGKLDYLRKPLSLYDQGKLYPMFSDQQVSIAFIDEVSETLIKIIEAKKHGIFHSSSSDTSTPFDLVSYMLEKVRGVTGVVKPSSLDEFIASSGSSPVRYPKFGGLKIEKTQKSLGLTFRTCKQIVDELVLQGVGG